MVDEKGRSGMGGLTKGGGSFYNEKGAAAVAAADVVVSVSKLARGKQEGGIFVVEKLERQ